MAIPFLNNLNLNNNEVQNVKLHNTGSAPNNAAGQVYFNTSDTLAKYYSNGTDLWVSLKEYSFTNGTYIDVTTTGTTVKPILEFDISAIDGTAGASERYLTKNNTWAEVAAIPGTYTWTVASDSGSEAVASGDTITFVGGTNITTSYNSTSNELTINTSGVMTGFTVAGDNGANQTISNSDTLTISGGPVIVTTGVATDELIVKHDVVTNTPTTSTASPAHGGTFTAVDSVTVSSEGHVTGINTKTVTLPADNNTDTLQSIAADSTNNDRYITTVANATGAQTGLSHSTLTYNPSTETLNVTNLVVSGTSTTINTETINLADNIITLNSNYSGSSPTENSGIEVERGTLDNAVLRWNETSDRWEFTNDGGTTYYNIPISTEYNNYIHPTHPGDDINVDTGALTGATVVSDIDINITTDTLGHVTDANGVISTRTLTLGDLGYTGATDADNYGSWSIRDGDTTTYTITSGDTLQIASGGGITSNFTADDVLTISHNDTSSQASVNNSGRTYIQDITLDTYGHITGITSATETVTNTDTQLATAAALIDVSAMGANTTASFTHGLASKNLIVQMYDVTTGEVVFADIDHTSNNAISIIFASTPTNDIRVVVLDAKNGLTDKTVSYS